MVAINYFHVHLYYSKDTFEEAKRLREEAGTKFSLPQGKLHERPVGPHPVWSCQLTLPTEKFGEVVPWLALNRGNLDIFIHPDTGHDMNDHTKHVMWLGKSYELNLAGL